MADDEIISSTSAEELRTILRRKRRQNILATLLAVAVIGRLLLFVYQAHH